MITKAVTVSGSVGKQIFPTSGDNRQTKLLGWLLSPISANAKVTISEGERTSGTVQYDASQFSADTTLPVELPKGGQRFDRGMHVKVVGAGAVCYLFLE